MTARNKANYLAAKMAFNQRNMEECLRFYASNHQVMSKACPPGRKEIHRFLEDSIKAWPDIEIAVEQVVAEGNMVMGRSVAKATHSMEIFDIAPTHRRVETTFWDLHRFDEEGLIVQTWNLMDSLTLMLQLRAIPASR